MIYPFNFAVIMDLIYHDTGMVSRQKDLHRYGIPLRGTRFAPLFLPDSQVPELTLLGQKDIGHGSTVDVISSLVHCLPERPSLLLFAPRINLTTVDDLFKGLHHSGRNLVAHEFHFLFVLFFCSFLVFLSW